MKIACSILILLLSHVCCGQNVVSLVDNEIHSLNGGFRSEVGGKSRITIPISIPHTAKGIIYTIQAYRATETPVAMDLAMAVGTYMLTKSISLASAASKLQIPISTQTVDAFILLSQKDESLFINKKDGYWNSYTLANREACVNCKVSLECTPGEKDQIVYIAIRNPSTFDAINISVNVVAIEP